MKQIYKILLTLLLSLLIGTTPISAQIVDEQGQYVDTTFHDNVNRTAEDSLGLCKDSVVVDSILTNIDSNDEAVDDIVERGDSCEADTIGQTESKTTFWVRYCYDKNRTLKENLWDWIAIGLMCLIVLGIIVVACMHIKLNLWKERNIAVQVLLIFVIVFIAIYSDSQWAYLALMVLCLLGIFKFNPNLLKRFINILKAVYGNYEVIEMGPLQIEKKVEAEFKEVKMKSGYMLDNCGDVRREVLKQDNGLKKYIELEQLALNMLEKQYPNLQKYVQIKAHPKYNFELDGLIEEKNIVYAVDVKYIHDIFDMEHLSQRMSKIVYFVTTVIGKPTKMLLLLITSDKSMRNKILNELNDKSVSDYTPIVKVYTEQELENLNNQK